jgi:hypothetical protein
MKRLMPATVAALALAAPAQAMSTMTNATGPYNYTCEELIAAKPAKRAIALAYAQGYVAALNMELDAESQGESPSSRRSNE